MTAPSIPVLARHKLSLIAILVISLAVWLVVLSSWSGVLHAIGKLRTGASGFGTVNIFMLGAAIGWCTLVFLVLKVEFDLPRNFRSVLARSGPRPQHRSDTSVLWICRSDWRNLISFEQKHVSNLSDHRELPTGRVGTHVNYGTGSLVFPPGRNSTVSLMLRRTRTVIARQSATPLTPAAPRAPCSNNRHTPLIAMAAGNGVPCRLTALACSLACVCWAPA